MYVGTVVCLFVIPLLSVGVEWDVVHAPLSLGVLEKWYVFWAVGIRLLLAGVRQMLQPAYTRTAILGIQDSSSHLIVRDLGIANSSIGAVAIIALIMPAWRQPAALAGALFYGLAGINHAGHSGRTPLQNVAMITDVLAASILLALFVLVKS